mgnify:CR=1 FL=1|tara:strand:+ start:848 stop:1015 length:168 start_codon:yes stop_codon:yes gene_type:complete
MCWVYKYIDNGVYGTSGAQRHYAVGYYIGDNFEIISYFEDENDAINRVSKLNGGV